MEQDGNDHHGERVAGQSQQGAECASDHGQDDERAEFTAGFPVKAAIEFVEDSGQEGHPKEPKHDPLAGDTEFPEELASEHHGGREKGDDPVEQASGEPPHKEDRQQEESPVDQCDHQVGLISEKGPLAGGNDVVFKQPRDLHEPHRTSG